jgi:hypothetical protein
MFAVRTHLGHETMTGAWDEGQAMTLEQAIEYALNVASENSKG